MIRLGKEEEMAEQLKLHFRGHPLVDTSFRKYNVHLYRNTSDKMPVFVSGIWAKNIKQAIVKAAKKARIKRYSIDDSLAIPTIKPKGFL